MPTCRGPTFLWPLWGWNMSFQDYSNTMSGEILLRRKFDYQDYSLISAWWWCFVFFKVIHRIIIEEKYYFTWPKQSLFPYFFFVAASPPFQPVQQRRRLSEIAIKVLDEKIAESNRVVTPYFLIEMQTLT